MRSRSMAALVLLFVVGLPLGSTETRESLHTITVYVMIASAPVTADSTPDGRVMYRVGNQTIHLADDQVLWDGSAEWPGDRPDLKMLSAPRVMARVDQGVVIRSNWTQELQYFEVDGDCFRLKTVDPSVEPGVRLDATLRNPSELVDGTKVIEMDFGVRVTVFGPRTKIPGVSLDVGAPTIHTADTQSSMQLVLGTWDMLMVSIANVHGESRTDSVFLLIRVDELSRD
jgi:hypothetical protein